MKQEHLHRYKYLWRKCQERETIIAAWKKLRKGKTTRAEVIEIEKDFDHNVDLMQAMLRETRPDGDPDKMFTPEYQQPKFIFEHGKQREIYRPKIWDQWVHHIVIIVLAPILLKHSYAFSCGSMPKRGGVYGKRKLERVIKRQGFKYFAKLDIRHFFNSVNIRYVTSTLRKLIEDEWFIFLVERMFMHFPDRLPLGYYPSQWFANYVLSPLDWVIARRKPLCYIRYVDDFVICSNNKRWLHKIIDLIKKELGRIHLRLKDNFQVIRFDYVKKDGKRIGRPIDFMGFVFLRDKTILRKSIMLRTTRFAARLGKLPVLAVGQAHSMLSRGGWFKHTATKYIWRERVQPNISVVSLKDIVRKYQRRFDNENTLERGNAFSSAPAVRAA